MSRWTPYVTVASVVERAGAFLMVEEDRGGPETLFNQPAGHLEPNERIRDAAQREVQEETAWQVALPHYLGLYVYTSPKGLTFHSHSFSGMVLAHLGSALDPAILAVHWLTLEELEALEQADRLRSPLVMRRVRDTLAGRFYPLEAIHER